MAHPQAVALAEPQIGQYVYQLGDLPGPRVHLSHLPEQFRYTAQRHLYRQDTGCMPTPTDQPTPSDSACIDTGSAHPPT